MLELDAVKLQVLPVGGRDLFGMVGPSVERHSRDRQNFSGLGGSVLLDELGQRHSDSVPCDTNICKRPLTEACIIWYIRTMDGTKTERRRTMGKKNQTTTHMLQKSDFTEYALGLGIWEGLCEDHGVSSNAEEIEITVTKTRKVA